MTQQLTALYTYNFYCRMRLMTTSWKMACSLVKFNNHLPTRKNGCYASTYSSGLWRCLSFPWPSCFWLSPGPHSSPYYCWEVQVSVLLCTIKNTGALSPGPPYFSVCIIEKLGMVLGTRLLYMLVLHWYQGHKIPIINVHLKLVTFAPIVLL